MTVPGPGSPVPLPGAQRRGSSYRRIVVAHNDTPAARRALRQTTALARAHGVELTAVTIQDRLPHYAATRGEVEEELAVEARACRRGLAAARAYADERGYRCAVRLARARWRGRRPTPPGGFATDLIVLGTTGRRRRTLLPFRAPPPCGWDSRPRVPC